MLDVAKEDIDLAPPVVDVTKTILMDVHLPRDPLTIQGWSDEDVIKAMRFTI